jgi:hypothetical protein
LRLYSLGDLFSSPIFALAGVRGRDLWEKAAAGARDEEYESDRVVGVVFAERASARRNGAGAKAATTAAVRVSRFVAATRAGRRDRSSMATASGRFFMLSRIGCRWVRRSCLRKGKVDAKSQ